MLIIPHCTPLVKGNIAISAEIARVRVEAQADTRADTRQRQNRSFVVAGIPRKNKKMAFVIFLFLRLRIFLFCKNFCNTPLFYFEFIFSSANFKTSAIVSSLIPFFLIASIIFCFPFSIPLSSLTCNTPSFIVLFNWYSS